MRLNAVLLWVVAILLGSLLALIMMILHGSVDFESEWIQPSTIATLIGGLGGALAGTWLSGKNATRLYVLEREQVESQAKYDFYRYVKLELFQFKVFFIELEVTAILVRDFKENSGRDITDEELEELFQKVYQDFKKFNTELVKSFDNILKYKEHGKIDWGLLDNIRRTKMVLSLTLDDIEHVDNVNNKFMSIYMINQTFTQIVMFFDSLKEIEEKISVATYKY